MRVERSKVIGDLILKQGQEKQCRCRPCCMRDGQARVREVETVKRSESEKIRFAANSNKLSDVYFLNNTVLSSCTRGGAALAFRCESIISLTDRFIAAHTHIHTPTNSRT